MPISAQSVTQVYYDAIQNGLFMGVEIRTVTLMGGQALTMAHLIANTFVDALIVDCAAPVSQVTLLSAPVTVLPYAFTGLPNMTVQVAINTAAAVQTAQQARHP